jgi:hypothetical protein
MSLDSQSDLIPPSTVDPPLLAAQLNGTNLNGHALGTNESSPASERLQVINDEKNFTSVLLTCVNFLQVLNDSSTGPIWPLR